MDLYVSSVSACTEYSLESRIRNGMSFTYMMSIASTTFLCSEDNCVVA